VCRLDGSEFAKEGSGQAPLYLRVANWYGENGYRTINVPRIGPVKLDKRAVTRSIRHGLTHTQGVAFAAVPAALSKGRIIHEGTLRGSNEGLIYYVAAPIAIASESFVVVVMVKKDQIKTGHWGARMYLHSVISKRKLRRSAYPSGVGIGFEGHPYDTHSAETGVVWTLLSGLYAVNREGACGTSV